MITIVLFIIGFILLIKGADIVVDGASALAKKFRVSDLVIGLTVVAFGTSAPELFVNIFASIEGSTDLALGNVVGSNIANIFLILGVTAIIYPLVVSKGVVWRQMPFNLLAAGLLMFLVNDIWFNPSSSNLISRSEGVVLMILFCLFLYHMFGMANIKAKQAVSSFKDSGVSKPAFYIILGLVGLTLGARWIVDGAVELAAIFGLSQTLIGVTIIALGTSLPELATSVTAALKKNIDIAVGNAVGSSIFNIFLVLGVSAIINPLRVPLGINFDLGTLLVASGMLFVFMFVGKKHIMDRKVGIIFLGFYIAYLALVIVRG